MGGTQSHNDTFHLVQKLQDDIANERLPTYAIPQKREQTILRSEPRVGEKKYQTWHTSSPTANVSKDLKGKISQIFGSQTHKRTTHRYNG